MIPQVYKDMLKEKDIIFEIFDFARAREKEVGVENVYDFSLGNPSVLPPQSLNIGLNKVLTEENPLAIHSYSPAGGVPEVREAVAKSLNKRFDMKYESKNIFMSVGAAGALAHAFRAVTEPGDEIITFAPCFSEYKPYVSQIGVELKIVPADIDSFQINFDEFAKMMNPKVAAILINSPNNPSGIVLSTPTIQKLADFLKDKEREYGHPIYLISDEPYREIIFEGTDAPYPAKYYENTLTCYSFSKSISVPGERIGYIAIHPKCQGADILPSIFTQISRTIGHNGAPSLMQRVLPYVLEDTADLSIYETNKKLLYNALIEYGYTCVEPGGSFYMFPRSLEPDASAFCQKAREELNLMLVPGDNFGCPGHFRISYCVPTEKVIGALPLFKRLAEMYRLTIRR